MNTVTKYCLTILLLVAITTQINLITFAKDPKKSISSTLNKLRHFRKLVSSISSIKSNKCSYKPTQKQISKVKEGLYSGRLTFRSGNKQVSAKLKIVAANGLLTGLFAHGKNIALILFSPLGSIGTSEDLKLLVEGDTLKIRSLKCVKLKSSGTATLVNNNNSTPNKFKGLYSDDNEGIIVNIAKDGSTIIIKSFISLIYLGEINNSGDFTTQLGPKTSKVTLKPTSNNTLQLTAFENGEEVETVNLKKVTLEELKNSDDSEDIKD